MRWVPPAPGMTPTAISGWPKRELQRLVALTNRGEHSVGRLQRVLDGSQRSHLSDISACGEEPRPTRDDDYAHSGAMPQPLDHVGDSVLDCEIQCVAALRAVDRHHEHPGPRLLDLDVSLGGLSHVTPSGCCSLFPTLLR